MTYFHVGNSNLTSQCKQPFVEFSPNEDRANLMSMSGTLAPRRKRSRSTLRRKSRAPGRRRRTRRTKTRVTKVRVVNGKVSLRVGGFPGVQRVGASQLVRFVPLNKLRTAAKRVLGASGGGYRNKRRRKRTNRRRRRQT